MTSPLISICIPAYRAVEFIDSSLKSVAAQTYSNWEVIVTEDGTDDGTRGLVEQFSTQHSRRVVYERHDENRGLPATRNTGISAARGEWVAFLDADDVWKSDHLEGLVAATHAARVECVFAASVWFERDPSTVIRTAAPSVRDLANLPLAIFTGALGIQPSASMVRRSFIERIGGFSPSHPICNDLEYWLRIARYGGRIAYSERATCFYRRHSRNMTAKDRDLALTIDLAETCLAYSGWAALPFFIRRTRPAVLLYWAGRMAMTHDPLRAESLLRRSVRQYPFSARVWYRWAQAQLRSRRHVAVSDTVITADQH